MISGDMGVPVKALKVKLAMEWLEWKNMLGRMVTMGADCSGANMLKDFS